MKALEEVFYNNSALLYVILRHEFNSTFNRRCWLKHLIFNIEPKEIIKAMKEAFATSDSLIERG